MDKMFMWTMVAVFGTIGGWIPTLWGAGMFDLSGIIGSAIGSILGIYIAFKMGRR